MIVDALNVNSLESELITEIQQIGRLKSVKSGSHIIDADSAEKLIPFVLKGLLKVYRYRQDGSKVLLYYLEKGETCSMSITCCIEKTPSNVQVVAEEDSEIWLIPNSNLDRWLVKYPSFRRFVFRSYQTRFDELINTIDSLVFTNMEERLYKYLLDTKQATESFEIKKTHQEIASDLSTSRVVVSRLLKKMELEDKISQKRNRIEIL